jgi:hypothetical protein
MWSIGFWGSDFWVASFWLDVSGEIEFRFVLNAHQPVRVVTAVQYQSVFLDPDDPRALEPQERARHLLQESPDAITASSQNPRDVLKPAPRRSFLS